MVKGAVVLKLAASGAAVGAAILAGTAHAGFVTSPATLTQSAPGCSQSASSQVCGNLFPAAGAMTPVDPPSTGL